MSKQRKAVYKKNGERDAGQGQSGVGKLNRIKELNARLDVLV